MLLDLRMEKGVSTSTWDSLLDIEQDIACNYIFT